MERLSSLAASLQPWHLIAAGTLGPIAVIVTASLISIFCGLQYPSNLPRLREEPGARSFSLKTRRAYYTDCEALYREAYEKYGKLGKTVLVPGLGLRSEVILAPSALRWAAVQPDNVLSACHAFAELDQLTYTIGEDRFVLDSWNGLVIKRDMNAVLESVVAVLKDELSVAFDEQFGTDTEAWREIDLVKVMPHIITQAASRYTVGLPLCRDMEYRQTTIAVSNFVIIMAAVMGLIPPLLKPILGPIAAVPMNAALRKFHRLFRPEFEKRMDKVNAGEKGSVEEPEDLLQMTIRYGLENRRHEFSFLEISKRLALTNMGTTHQTNMAVINMILEIIESDGEFNTVSLLRDEMRRVLGEGPDDGSWTKAKIAKMVKADSVGREALRKTSFGNRAMIRMVVADSLRTPDGILLPKGSIVSVLTPPQHFDEAAHEDATKFDPFRFSRAREAEETKGGALGFTSTGASFLPFGHGRHACPGRFLVDYEMKMIMAYLLENYDVKFPEEYQGRRPKLAWKAEACMIPSGGARIRVKRRAASA